ncbi:Uncharacterised protein [Mycobacteroides abscessus subsp. abscessus]|nr:Uncharacterised protein [Mycobacteroides abscessus subsp. abscessus]
MAKAIPRPVCSSTRITPESACSASTVFPRTYRSYCSVMKARLHRCGLPIMSSSVWRSSAALAGRANPPAVSAINASWVSGRATGR